MASEKYITNISVDKSYLRKRDMLLKPNQSQKNLVQTLLSLEDKENEWCGFPECECEKIQQTKQVKLN